MLEHHGGGSSGGGGSGFGGTGSGADLLAAELGGEVGGVVVSEDDIVGVGGRRVVGPGAGRGAEGGEHLLEEVIVGSGVEVSGGGGRNLRMHLRVRVMEVWP